MGFGALSPCSVVQPSQLVGVRGWEDLAQMLLGIMVRDNYAASLQYIQEATSCVNRPWQNGKMVTLAHFCRASLSLGFPGGERLDNPSQLDKEPGI